jgi:hypothetical protein
LFLCDWSWRVLVVGFWAVEVDWLEVCGGEAVRWKRLKDVISDKDISISNSSAREHLALAYCNFTLARMTIKL